MKARVKATGEIIEVREEYDLRGSWVEVFYSNEEDPCDVYEKVELDFNVDDSIEIKNPDYWTRLEHQYAGMAMQGMLSNTTLITVLFDATKDHDELLKEVIICSHEYAHALVEKLKEKEK